MASSSKIYAAQEDSFIMKDALDKILNTRKIQNVLDVGTGTGILAFTASKKAKHVDAVDVNPHALNFVKQQIKKLNFRNINVFYSDLFSHVKEKYDLIIFNPPYLPDSNDIKEKWVRQAIIGGTKGNEVILKFLENAKNFLTENGKILFCCSSLSNPKIIEEKLNKEKYKWKILNVSKFWFENLYVYLAWEKT